MDLSALASIATSLKLASDFSKAAIGVRDFNQFAATISKVNEQLLNVQNDLLQLSLQTNGLVQQLANAEKKVLELQKAADERARYSLFEISTGVFVYRLKDANELTQISAQPRIEPTHYLCQRCFDSGTKSVLMRDVIWGKVDHVCSVCNVRSFERQETTS